MHLHTIFFCPFIVHVHLRYGVPHSPQMSSSVIAYLLEYLPCSVLVPNCLTFLFFGAPFQFFLNSAEGAGVDDSRMIILHVVFLSLAVIDLDRFAYAVCDISLIDNCIVLILFIREN